MGNNPGIALCWDRLCYHGRPVSETSLGITLWWRLPVYLFEDDDFLLKNEDDFRSHFYWRNAHLYLRNAHAKLRLLRCLGDRELCRYYCSKHEPKQRDQTSDEKVDEKIDEKSDQKSDEKSDQKIDLRMWWRTYPPTACKIHHFKYKIPRFCVTLIHDFSF